MPTLRKLPASPLDGVGKLKKQILADVTFRWVLGTLGVLQGATLALIGAEAVVLSPFEVTTNKNVGYLANDTLAGSRLRTNLADVPNAISVFTPEFMADLNAFSEADLMRYSASAVPERTDQTPAAQGISMDTGLFGFRIRGQLASRSRNYFGTALIPDTYNSERFEEARGPHAILFGLGGAGGILNTSTKTAQSGRRFTHLGFSGDSDGLFRATLDHNQKISEQVAFRLNALQHTTRGWQEDSAAKNQRWHLAGTYRPVRTISLRMEVEYGHGKSTLTRFYVPFDNVSLWKASGAPLVAGLANANALLGIGKRAVNTRLTFVGNDQTFHNFAQTVFSQPTAQRVNSVVLPGDWAAFDGKNPFPERASFSGPGGTSEYKQKSLGAVMEAEPFRQLFIELAAVNDLRDHDVYDTTHDVYRVLGEPGTTYREGTPNPFAGNYYVDTRWVLRRERSGGERFRLTASYQLDWGKWGRHQISALTSRDNTGNPRSVGFLVAAGSPFNAQPQNANNQLWTRRYITNPADTSQYAAPDFRRIPASFSVVTDQGAAPRTFTKAWSNNELNDQWSHTSTRLGALQSYFLKDRLVATAGWRLTELASFARPTNNPNTQLASRPESFGALRFVGEAPDPTRYDFERISFGVVGKATRGLSVYYNYSENGQPPGSTQTLIPDGAGFPMNAGEGKDYGVMSGLFGGRVFVRAGWFTTSSVDQSSAFGASNVAGRNDRIMDVLLANNLITAAKVVRFVGGDFDLADLATKGYEVNLTGNVTPSWRVIINVAKTRSVQTNMLKRSRPAAALVMPSWQTAGAQTLTTSAGVSVAQEIINYQNWLASATAVENTGTIGHRDLEGRAFTRYDFSQAELKGLFVGGGFSYGSSPVIGRSTAGNLFYASIRREIDLLFGYRIKLPAQWRVKNFEVQFNATNLLHQNDYTSVRRDPDGQLFRAAVNLPTNYAVSGRVHF
jgi:hypothetical protein